MCVIRLFARRTFKDQWSLAPLIFEELYVANVSDVEEPSVHPIYAFLQFEAEDAFH